MVVLTFSAICLLIGLGISLGVSGEYSLWQRSWLAVAMFFCTLFASAHFLKNQKTYQIDVSHVGEIRLSLYDAQRLGVVEKPEAAIMLESSTLWPQFILLNLRTASGVTQVLRIFPDAVSPDAYRSLLVAFRWIAARTESGDDQPVTG